MKTTQQFTSVEQALTSIFGDSTRVAETRRIAGGDINEAYKLTLTNGTHIFMKSNAKKEESFFTAEAEGLAAIAKTEAIGTPYVFGSGKDTDRGEAFLLMEFVEGKKHIGDYWETFAHQLAAMHQASTSDFVSGGTYGFVHDNYIGANKQVNTAHDSWRAFFRDCRLKPQFHQAFHYFDTEEQKMVRTLLEKTEDILIEPEYPSLLHGDLWAGNVITGNDGKVWLADPAVYVGHREAELAMTELFGGFPQSFYDAYQEVLPLQPGYEKRRDFYNLYHLLNHLNLFGRSYLSSVKRVVRKYTL